MYDFTKETPMKNKKLLVSLIAGILAGVMILSLLLSLIPADVYAASSSEIKDQISEMEKEQAELQKELEKLQSQHKENINAMSDAIAEKKNVDKQIVILYEQIDGLNDQISAYAVLIADKQAELDKANKDLEQLRQKHMERLRAIEENGSISYWNVLFQANSIMDLLDRLEMIQEIAAADRRNIQKMDEIAKQVEESRVELQREQADLRDRRQKMAAKQEELNQKREESERLLADLVARGEEYEKWMAEQEDKLADLEDEIANKESEYDRVKFEEWLATSVPPTTVPPTTGSGSSSSGVVSGPVTSMTSTTIWRSGKAMTPNTVDGITWYTPCDYNRISSTFGMRLHPIDGYVKPHKGVDFAIGHTPIYATRAGVVTIATTWEDDSAGYYVVIDHGDGFKSIYMHMCKPANVKPGDFVLAGTELGCVGSTGASTGNHLHFGISQYNSATKQYEYVNPLLYVK